MMLLNVKLVDSIRGYRIKMSACIFLIFLFIFSFLPEPVFVGHVCTVL